jgi:hypothetical protein
MNKEYIIEIEKKFDAINPNYRSKEELWIHCKSKRYQTLNG